MIIDETYDDDDEYIYIKQMKTTPFHSIVVQNMNVLMLIKVDKNKVYICIAIERFIRVQVQRRGCVAVCTICAGITADDDMKMAIHV